jgi:hypothetical protein
MIIYMCVLYRNMDCLEQLRAGPVLKCSLLKFQPLLEKIHRIALGLLMYVLSNSWVVCIHVRGPEDGSDKRQWEVPVCQCVCVGL